MTPARRLDGQAATRDWVAAFADTSSMAFSYCAGWYRVEAPPDSVLAIPSYEFELGTALSAGARGNRDAALGFLMSWLPGATRIELKSA